MDEDRPPERFSPLDLLGLLWSLPGRALAALHRFCHRWEPKCPDCAAKQKLADEWADRCRAEEAAHKAAVERLTHKPKGISIEGVVWDEVIAPGTPVLGGAEEGGVSYAGLAAQDHLLDLSRRDKLPVGPCDGKTIEQVIADFRDGPQTVAPEPTTRKSEGRPVIPLELGGQSISARSAAKRGTKHPAHSRPASAWPQRRSCVERIAG